MNQEQEGNENGPNELLLQKFWSRGKRNAAAYRNASDNNNLLTMVKRAFESFSEEQQQKIQRDQYGSGGEEAGVEEEESTAFINEKLQELDTETDLLSDNFKKACFQAIQQEIELAASAEVALAIETCSISGGGSGHQITHGEEAEGQYDKDDQILAVTSTKEYTRIRSRDFRLMFLRAENFDARRAARRMSRYFKEKKELFGVKKLARKTTQADLSETDIEVVSSGCFCSTGATDSHGRPIIFVSRKLMDNFPTVSVRRAAMYMIQILEDHEDWQRKGVIIVGDGRGMGLPQPSSEKRLYPAHRMLQHALPFRHACMHACYDTMAHHFFLRLAFVVFPANARSRFKGHYGATAQEIFAGLSEHGITAEHLPVTTEFEFQQELVEEFLMTLQREEEASKDFPHWLMNEILSWL